MALDDARGAPAPRRWRIELAARPAALTGDGALRYRDALRAARRAIVEQDVPPVRAALALGATRTAVATVIPLYLREADAVANFPTRERPT